MFLCVLHEMIRMLFFFFLSIPYLVWPKLGMYIFRSFECFIVPESAIHYSLEFLILSNSFWLAQRLTTKSCSNSDDSFVLHPHIFHVSRCVCLLKPPNYSNEVSVIALRTHFQQITKFIV